jgi:predicted secreted protein
MLNQNSKVDGGALCAGVYRPLVEALRTHGFRIEQMPCPELAYLGLNRFWIVKEQLDTTAYRRHCRRLAALVADAVAVRVAEGAEVVFVGLEGSPSMGVRVTSVNEEWGGRPDAGDSYRLAEGRGIFFEELEAELAARGVPFPRATGISHTLPDFDAETERRELDAFLRAGP